LEPGRREGVRMIRRSVKSGREADNEKTKARRQTCPEMVGVNERVGKRR